VRDHSLLVVVWARYAGQMIVVTPYAWHRGGAGFWRTRKLRLQLLRSLFLLLATLGFWGGLRYLPLAEASSVTFLAPTFVVLLSWPLLHERTTRARQIASTVGFIGIQQNKTVAVLTVISIVLTPPILVAGIYGMNFKQMPELEWTYGYAYSLVLMAATGLLTFGIARWRGWL